MKTVRILLTGGGSGGHIYPLLAVAEALQKKAVEENIELELCYLGPADQYSATLAEAGIKVYSLIYGKLRRYFSLLNLVDIPKFFFGLIQAFLKMFWLMPNAIFSKGGPGALPVVLAGWFYRVPILIHESDALPGLTNLLSARFAKRIAVGFENALKYFNPRKTAWTGNPLRRELLEGTINQEAAKEELNFNPGQPLLLILGGSQGSRRINEFIITILGDLLKETQVLHQTGFMHFRDIERLSRAALVDIPLQTEVHSRYKPTPYFNSVDLKKALSAADLVFGRAGAGAIFEIAAFAKPAILVPIPESANNHQRANAYEFAKSGAAIVIEEANLGPGIFLTQVRTLFKNTELRNKMSEAARKFFKPEATEVIVKELLRISA